MAQRYHLREGIIIRRMELPSGDVVVTLFSEGGKWRGLARKGKLPGGNLGRLSLFHHVTLQHYAKNDEDLSVITQVSLNGALAKLSHPEVYPFAHLLAELADKLSADVQPGESPGGSMYSYLAAGLRGLAQHDDPERVALTIAWKLLRQAGLTPRLQGCAHCGASDLGANGAAPRFDIAAGGVTCGRCNSGLPLAGESLALLERMVLGTVREALESSIGDPAGDPAGKPADDLFPLWRLLSRYLAYHVGALNSLSGLSRAQLEPAS
ncbi:DNA repair protein RecO [soil metagenome]